MSIEFLENERLKKQIDFIIEIDKIKNVMRMSKLFNSNRFENDAEHSWSICMMVILLKEYANFDFNIEKTLIMLLIHDIVEIDAGDTYLYSAERINAFKNEELAANRIFGILDQDQKKYFYELWKEFEDKKTNEAKIAAVFDRLEPILQNYINEGIGWKTNNIKYDVVIEKNKHIEDGSKEIWEFILLILHNAVEKGYLQK